MKSIDSHAARINALAARVNSIVRGKEHAVRLAVATLLARGHLLIEDVPGVGKTTLAFTLARSIDCSFQRIQFTSDLMPSDIIGVSIFNPERHEFEFRQGPVFANIVLADEINRTTPKTQSALLEAMNEGRVSVERKTYELPAPFMVIATQNPLEYRGTFPLPESQLDRFAVHLKLGYPSMENEKAAVLQQHAFADIEALGHVLDASDVIHMQRDVDSVAVDEAVLDYLMAIVSATRTDERIRLGASTRGAQFLIRVARAMAYLSGRDYVTPDDVKTTAPAVLGHRILLKRQTSLDEADALVADLAGRIRVPV